MTFSLVAAAQLALAEGRVGGALIALGAADGLRRRAGLRAWPSTRRAEAELIERVGHAMAPEDFEHALRRGSELPYREAVALVRGQSVPA